MNSPSVFLHVLLMILVELLPVRDGDLLMKIFKHLVTLFQSLEDLNIGLCTLDTLHSLLKLELGALDLGNFGLRELLFLQVNDGPLLLTFLDEFFDLVGGLLVLLLQLLLVVTKLALASFDVQDCLVVLSNAILTGSRRDFLPSWRISGWLCYTITFKAVAHFNC